MASWILSTTLLGKSLRCEFHADNTVEMHVLMPMLIFNFYFFSPCPAQPFWKYTLHSYAPQPPPCQHILGPRTPNPRRLNIFPKAPKYCYGGYFPNQNIFPNIVWDSKTHNQNRRNPRASQIPIASTKSKKNTQCVILQCLAEKAWSGPGSWSPKHFLPGPLVASF